MNDETLSTRAGDGNFPELPKPLLIAGGGQSWFTANQMRAYADAALAAVTAGVQQIIAERDALKAAWVIRQAPLPPHKVEALAVELGYQAASPENSAFAEGVRLGERAHGISGDSPAPATTPTEPVAWLYEHDGCNDEPILTVSRWPECREPWNETPLDALALAKHAIEKVWLDAVGTGMGEHSISEAARTRIEFAASALRLTVAAPDFPSPVTGDQL